ncbi:bifunctional transaldolase/phosoglucose isomerase [Albibacterium bauzanense]|uniref:Transaldolase n=1 Tax=Albibacterium bauzanense TaxID=653929 RepID=A0A4R1LTT3_9SPHI|nr:bifunctional transaldolase/phosoglucose isomerase [Albibacterium bauzanense]TCK80679.1 transaldolase [Albibacterium bauzanense]
MKNTVSLLDYGQSYWLDNLTRGKIINGEIKERVTEQGLRGITSNPSIFSKAFTSGDEYDNQIEKLAKEGKTSQEIYEALTVSDVQNACDILLPVFDASMGTDGFVSLEVSPYLARDTQGSMIEARRLYQAVNRVNCYIKIPGTREGVPAIEEMLYEGVNINITLLFSIENYEAVALAYLRALKRRLKEGKSLSNIVSVASFFLSRIDVLVDQILSHYIISSDNPDADSRPDLLMGKAGIASAKLAYKRFKEIFQGKDWEELVEKGANIQRVLWASTSTKNKLYKDVLYVDSLIGKDTVNTLPEETIEDFNDHGSLKKDAIEENIEEAYQVFDQLERMHIDLKFVTQQLENEGIQKFMDSYNSLIEGLEVKRLKALGDHVPTQEIALAGLDAKPVYASLDELHFGKRLFKQDPNLWKKDKEQIKEISERLGWLSLPEDSMKKLDELNAFAQQIKTEGFKHVVLLGMGGSSLCSEVVKESFGTADGYMELIVLDNVDPMAILEVEKNIDMVKTLFIVASKSGTTTETLSFCKYFFEKLKATGKVKPGNNFIAITDNETALVKTAKEYKFRKIFVNPSDLGGRYSVLSDFGLVPMALTGIDIGALLQSAQRMQTSCNPTIPANKNVGISLGTILGLSSKAGRDKVTFVLSNSIKSFGLWLEQLLAESTGKEGKGLIPIQGESLGTPEVYGKDRIFVHIILTSDDNSEDTKKISLLEKAGHPVIRISLHDKLDLGGEFYRWEVAVASAGIVMGINPFDQPNVEESKENTRKLLKIQVSKGDLKNTAPTRETEDIRGSIHTFLLQAKANDYIAILPYFLLTESRKELLQSWRKKIRDSFKVATTLLEGPRYLHSTGQLHKGGPDSGLYILFTGESEEDVLIPDEEYSFATLGLAEAIGDLKSLNDKGRRTIHIQLGKNIDNKLIKLA